MNFIDKVIQSFNYAIEGVIYTLKTQRNMRFHYFSAIIVLIIALFYDFNKYEFIILVSTITAVIVAEMINTSIEAALDFMSKDYHPLIKTAKDVAAGAVFITTINAVFVAYMLFFDKMNNSFNRVYLRIQQSPIHITFIGLILVFLITVITKTMTHKGTPLKGGLPSGHASVGFFIATSISFLSKNAFVTTLAFLLALLVAQSRVEGKIHTVLEVVFGTLMGILVGILIFQWLY